jgi:hypothetical protein
MRATSVNEFSEESTDESIPDLDDLIHRQENEDLPPAVPPETEEDFEKATQQSEPRPRISRIPPTSAD